MIFYALLYLFSVPNSLGEIGYLIDAEVVGDQLVVLDLAKAELVSFSINKEAGEPRLGDPTIIASKGPGPGELDFPEVLFRDEDGLWVASRFVPKAQKFGLPNFKYQTAFWYPYGKPILSLVPGKFVIMHPEFEEGMIHAYDTTKMAWDPQYDCIPVSKESHINEAKIGDHLALTDGSYVYFADALNLRLEKWTLAGKKQMSFRQDWMGVQPWTGKKRFDGKTSLMDFKHSITTFVNAGNFLFRNVGKQYLVTTLERPDQTPTYVIQIFDTETGELVSRWDEDRYPIGVYESYFILGPSEDSEDVVFMPFNKLGGVL